MITKRIDRAFEVRQVTDAGTFTGYGSVFGIRDTYGDVVERGAFKASLAAWKTKGRLPPLLWQHDSGKPIGVWRSMSEDDRGLVCEGELALKTEAGSEAYELLKLKAVSGLSIGYALPKGGGTWDPKTQTFRLTQIDLWETSLVTMPANDSARVEAVKVAMQSERGMERLLRDAGLSRSMAKALLAGGYDRLASGDLEGDDLQLEQLLKALRS